MQGVNAFKICAKIKDGGEKLNKYFKLRGKGFKIFAAFCITVFNAVNSKSRAIFMLCIKNNGKSSPLKDITQFVWLLSEETYSKEFEREIFILELKILSKSIYPCRIPFALSNTEKFFPGGGEEECINLEIL